MMKTRFFSCLFRSFDPQEMYFGSLQVKTSTKTRILFLILFFCLNSSLLLGQNTSKEGKLIQKPWTKTGQSYCAQGGEYWVLQTNPNKEWVLEGTEEQKKAWKPYANRQVRIKGKIETKTIEPTLNLMEQRPVTQNPITGKDEPYTCTVLKVNTLDLLEKKK